MRKYKQNPRLGLLLTSTMISAALFSSSVAFAGMGKEAGCSNVAVPLQQRADITLIDMQAAEQKGSTRSVQPTPAQPGLLPPEVPEPAAPHLAPAPPPMPQPAEPPPLSQRPDLNPVDPGAPKQQPLPSSPHSEPEPTVYRQ
jgi:hypothetical protein